MNWVIFVTLWIISQTIIRTALQPKLSKLHEHSDKQLVGAIIGRILWGLAMIGSLYMAGLYD